MTLIVDASVALKWLFEEEGTAAALKLLGAEPLTAPDFLLLEAHHVMWKRVRRGESAAAALRDLASALAATFVTFAASGGLIADAARKSQNLAHPIYDCLYIALAEREGATLVTADHKQFAAARKARVKVRML
jgi:predicted nucleic acid-binding protein